MERNRFLLFARGLAAAGTAVAVLLSAIAGAQEGKSISGTVVDESGGALVGAKVTIASPEGRAAGTTETDTGGSFLLPGLGPGRFLVTVENPQFETVRVEVTVDPLADPAPLRVILKVAGLLETVNVEATGLVRETATAATRFEARALDVPQSTQSVTSPSSKPREPSMSATC